nr:carbon-nitrogen hydrolase family protein [Nakamurella flavida]
MAQITSTDDVDHNAALVADHTARAADAGARLVVFPEATMCAFGVPLGPVAQRLDGRWADGVRAAAQRHGLTVVAGMFTPAQDGRVHNTLLATGAGVEAAYRKIHLFDAYGFAESRTVAPGTDPVTVDVPQDGPGSASIGVGLTTCYDVRFPGLYQVLADRGARIVVVAASWGAGPGKREQWELLTRARAVDSTCVIAACGQADPAESGRRTHPEAPTGIGHSAVVGPTGEVLDSLGAAPGLLVVDVDPTEVERAREVNPVLVNRRF